MFSTVAAAPGTTAVASSALRSAGLIDRDARMKDATEKPGGRKGISKLRPHRNRLVEALKEQPSSSSRTHPARSNPISIRGAADRPTIAGRLRRNAVSSSSADSRPNKATSVHRTQTGAVETWREFVNKRWNPEARFLNLESMGEDELLKRHHLSPPGSGGSVRDAAVIFKLASQLKPEVQTISLAKNHITGGMLAAMPRYLPRLANLSLANNKIRTPKDLESITSKKGRLEYLRELILVGNPVREEEVKQGQLDRYRTEMTRRFPSLEILDSEPVTQIGFDVPQPSTANTVIPKPSATTFPTEMQPSFITGVDGAMVSNFLMRFFTTFDNQRETLVNAYHPSSTFSYSINTSIPQRARIAGLHTSRDLPNQRKLDWGPWIQGGDGGSRNLSRGFVLDKQYNSLHFGGEAAVKSMIALPGTKHDIGGPPEKFCVDSFPVPHGDSIGLLLVVHGEFIEVGVDGIRSFDRSFILAPAPEGSAAKTHGWDVVILSDQWIVRHYSTCDAWRPGPMRVQASDPKGSTPAAQQPTLTLSPDQLALLQTIPEFQQPLAVQVCQRTSLNVKFAVDCLTGNGWDVERAVANFNEVKGTLGREAFL
ncbi:NXF family protein [Pleurotus pulmonarius]